MSFGFYKLKKIPYFLSFLFLFLLIPLYTTQAFVEWLGKVLIGGLIWLSLFTPLFLSWAFSTVAGRFLTEVSNPSFITKRYIEIGFVKEGWTLCANLAGIFLVLTLIAIGVSVALRTIKNPGETLIKFAFQAVLIPFTPIIAGFVIDFSNVFTYTFFRTGAAQGFIGGLNVFSAAVDAFNSMFTPGAGMIDAIYAMVASVTFLIIYGFLVGIVLWRFGILFFARYVALWMIIILSPLAFCFEAMSSISSKDFPPFEFFTKLAGYYKKWWEQLFQWATIGILGSLFMYIAGMTAMSLMSSDVDLIDGSWFIKLVGENILPFLIPILMLHMGYKLTLEWAPKTAGAIIQAVEGTIKTIVTVAAGVATAGASAAGGAMAGSATGQAAATSMQARGASMMQKPGLKTFGYAINRMGTNIKAAGARHNQRIEAAAQRKMQALAGLDKGETLRGMALPGKNIFNAKIVDAQQKAKDKALYEQDKNEFAKGRIGTGDPKIQSMLETGTKEYDKDTVRRIFENNPGLINSNEGFAKNARKLLASAFDKELIDQGKESEADQNIKKSIFKGITDKILENWKKDDFLDPEIIKGLAQNSGPSAQMSASKRGGQELFKQMMGYMLDTEGGYKARDFVNSVKNPEQIAELGKDSLSSNEMMNAISKFGLGNKNLLDAMLKNLDDAKLDDFINGMDKNAKQKFFGSALKDDEMQILGNKIAKDIIMENMAKFGSAGGKGGGTFASYMKVGGPDLAQRFSQSMNDNDDFRKTVVMENPGLISYALSPNAALSGVELNVSDEIKKMPGKGSWAQKYAKHYKDIYSKTPPPQNNNP